MQKQASTAAPRREVSRTAKLLTVSCALALGLLIFEVFLRLVGYTYPAFYTPDRRLGYALRPGVEGWYRKEGEVFVSINSRGLRDREHELPKPPDTFRVAVVGDSYAEALQVPRESAFWAVLEKRLPECGAFGGRRVEVINFGVSGYGTAQELITLRERVWDYSPDLVLLAVTPNNDITDNSRALKKTDEVPYFVLRGGELVADDSFRETKAFRLRSSRLNRSGRWVRDRLRFIQAIHQSHGAIKNAVARWRERRAAGAAAAEAGPATAPPDEFGIDSMIYREPADAVWREAWEVTEKLISRMHEEVRGRGAEFLVVTVSSGVQASPDPPVRESFRRRLGVADLFYPDRRLKALGEREGFGVINLAQPLQRYAEQQRVYLHGFGGGLGNGHWNEAGHAAAGELIARELCAGAPR